MALDPLLGYIAERYNRKIENLQVLSIPPKTCLLLEKSRRRVMSEKQTPQIISKDEKPASVPLKKCVTVTDC